MSAELIKRNSGYVGIDDPDVFKGTVKDGQVKELKIDTRKVADLTPLQALPFLEVLDCGRLDDARGILADLTPLKSLSLKKLILNFNEVRDLTPLQGMPLEFLAANGNPVSDLSFLKGLSLKTLDISRTNVRDLTPLKGMQIEYLGLSSNPISDLSPLSGMPVATLWLANIRLLPDLTPLKSLPLAFLHVSGSSSIFSYDPICEIASLKELSLDMDKLTKENETALLKLPNLEKINGEAARPLLTNIELWRSVPRVEPRATLQASAKKIMDIVFGPDSSWLASTSADGALQIWNVADQKLKTSVTAKGIPHQAFCSADGSWIAFSDSIGEGDVTDTTGALYFLDPKTGNMFGEAVQLGGYSMLALSPDGKTLAVGMRSGKDKGLIRLFDPQERRLLKEFRSTEKGVSLLHFIGNGKQMVVNGENANQLYLLRSSSGEGERIIDHSSGISWSRYGAMPTADGRKLAVTSSQSALTIVDLENAQQQKKVIPTGLAGLGWSIWHPDGHRLFIGGDHDIAIIDVDTGRLIARIAGATGGIGQVAVSPDGKTFALRCGDDGKIYFYNMSDLPK